MKTIKRYKLIAALLFMLLTLLLQLLMCYKYECFIDSEIKTDVLFLCVGKKKL